MLRNKCILIIACITLLVCIASCSFESTGPEHKSGDADVQINSEDFDCEPLEWTDIYSCYIAGEVTNMGDGDASVVSIHAEFFDSKGIKIEECLDYIGDLRVGQTAYYEVQYYNEKYPDDYTIWAEWMEY